MKRKKVTNLFGKGEGEDDMVKLIADLKEAIKKEGLVVPGINNRFLLSSMLITFNRKKVSIFQQEIYVIIS